MLLHIEAQAYAKIIFLRVLAGGDVACEAHTQLSMAASTTIGFALAAGAHSAFDLQHTREPTRMDDRAGALEVRPD
jgi:hypothetical protein